AGADDHGADTGGVEYAPGGDVRNRYTVFPRDARKRLQEILIGLPTTGLFDEPAVLVQRPTDALVVPVRLAPAKPTFGQQAAGDRAVSQEVHTRALAEFGH